MEHLVHPQPPTFYGFQASESPNETRRPPYQWSLGAAGGPASPGTVGANGGSTKVPRAKKMIFSKVVPRPLGMLKQVYLGRLEPVVARFGPWEIPKCLENGPLNLAIKPQATTTTTRHHSVLATAPSHRLELDSTLAILEPRWWPCQIQVLSHKVTGGGPGRWRQVGRCPPKPAQFWAKNSHFSPKTALVRVQNSPTKANGCYTPRAA